MQRKQSENRVEGTEKKNLWIDVELHWIWAVRSVSMEGAGTVLIGSVQAKVHVLQ